MMQQYFDIKKQYPDSLLFFRMGDFYELFFQDAETASRELEITLTGRSCGLEERAPMCGVPHHAATGYIDRLVSNGYKVAICEQIEDVSQAKGIVKRDVVRVITPGTLIDTQLLDDKKNNYLMSVFGSRTGFGLAYVDISTGDLFATEIKENIHPQMLIDEMGRVLPQELLYFIETDKEDPTIISMIKKRFDFYTNGYEEWSYEDTFALNQIKDHFNVVSLEGLGFHPSHLGINAAGALFHYLKTTQKRALEHINHINVYSIHEKMTLDINTRKNLELTETIRSKSKKGSLLGVLDKTSTAMGGRMLRKWIEAPLIDPVIINKRLEAVQLLKEQIELRQELKESLKKIYDLERLAGKISYGSVTPRDLIALKNSLSYLPSIINGLEKIQGETFQSLVQSIDPLDEVHSLVELSILEDAPLSSKDGGIIQEGYHKEVDELKNASTEGRQWIAQLEQKERVNSGIKSLKIKYNKIFGYYIEITKSNLSMVPTEYIRKQTLANCERYVTPELKEIESKILGAEEKVILLEYHLFIEVREKIAHEITRIQQTARAIAELDVLYSFAEIAAENNFIKPHINTSNEIKIVEGRHPVVELTFNKESFVPNDTYMDNRDCSMSIITGPNMAGKSTYMRQVALIVLMAQIGSFVPASEASIGIVDRIFTRIGASDDLAQGHSTFMVEMSEMANILNNATANSLVILDEIGRGTSTFDGLSIAWAVIEYMQQYKKSKTLFSTHYHELTELEGKIQGVKNYNILVEEDGEEIVFLRKVVSGSTSKSYGIQVAKLAGLPLNTLIRAQEILSDLEKKNNEIKIPAEEEIALSRESEGNSRDTNGIQLDLTSFSYNEIIEDIRSLNLLETTPMTAMNLLYQLQKRISSL